MKATIPYFLVFILYIVTYNCCAFRRNFEVDYVWWIFFFRVATLTVIKICVDSRYTGY